MSGPAAPSAAAGIWPRGAPSTSTGPIPNIGNPSTNLPVINNANLPLYNSNAYPSSPQPIPQLSTTPFLNRPPLGTTTTSLSNNYTTPNPLTLNNAVAAAAAAANANQNAQNEVYQRRLTQLEDENALRRNNTANMQQMGVQILQGQMDVQEHVLEYQFMLEQCMNTLDTQNHILTEQAEELALLRSKMRHLEYLMDAYKASKEGNMMLHNMSRYGNVDSNSLCCGEPPSLPAPSTSPFFAGGPTRITASTFQPFNPRYRSPTSRAKTAATLNQRNSVTPTNTSGPTTAANRPARRFGPANN